MVTESEYKAVCARPGVLPRWVLRATADRLGSLDAELSAAVARELARPPLPKPPLHAGGPEADHFRLSLPPELVRAVADALFQLEAVLAAAVTHPTRHELEFVAGLANRWNRITQNAT